MKLINPSLLKRIQKNKKAEDITINKMGKVEIISVNNVK